MKLVARECEYNQSNNIKSFSKAKIDKLYQLYYAYI